MGRIIFLNRFYWPDEPATAQLLTDLAEGLAARGREVAVITSHPGTANVPEREHHASVAIHRVRSHRGAESSVVRKALAFSSFYVRATSLLRRLARAGDTVVVLTDPPLLTVTATFVARSRGARVLNWIQDIYPEIAMELTGHRWLGCFRPLRDRAWRRAAACVTLGRDMAAVVSAAGVPSDQIAIIPNWSPTGREAPAPETVARLRTTWKLNGRFVVAYSGNLGRVHDLGPVLDVAAELHDDPRVSFLFIGRGAQHAFLQAEAVRRGLTHVHFVPPVPRADLAVALAVGDLHLVTLLPRCERHVFPSKLYGVAAAQRPVVFIGPPESGIAGQIRDHGFGVTFDRTAIEAIAAAISNLANDPAAVARLGAAAGEFAAAHAFPSALAAWENQLDAVHGHVDSIPDSPLASR